MELNQLLTTALSRAGISELNKMQETALQAIQQEQDVTLLAPTGSGKTLAFLLPILNMLREQETGVQCLIITPTRELGIQIERVWQSMSTGYKVNTCYGGHSMPLEVQNLSQPPALLIGTPGRITEHITRGSFDVKTVKMLILDEFDKSLSLGFHEQMADIIKALPAVQKRVLVSATDKLSIPKFTGIINPKVLNFTRTAQKTTDGLALKTVLSDTVDLTETLFRLLCHLGGASTLIFCNQRETTEQVCAALGEMGIRGAFFHGGLEQIDREKTLVQFRNGTTTYLVASDLAARGLDIPEVQHVIHYELPMKHSDFIHRNGRTARMHAEGTAYLLMHVDAVLPTYLSERPEVLVLPDTWQLPPASPWLTLYISGGKKDKLSKGDIVGFLSQKGGLSKEDLGKIEIMDFMSFVAVKKTLAGQLVQAVQAEKMKGKKYKIQVNQ